MKYLLLILLPSCSLIAKRPSEPVSVSEGVYTGEAEKVYQEELKHARTWGSWIDKHECDGTLWNGIACFAGASNIDILLAEYEPGQIHRNPPPSCFRNGTDFGAKTTISGDMLLGYTLCLAARKDLPALERLKDYATQNNFIMGEPRHFIGRVLMKTNLVGDLWRLIHSLSGKYPGGEMFTPPVFVLTTQSPDYAYHLSAIGLILSRISLDGYITQNMISHAIKLTKKYPKDPLFWAIRALDSGDWETPSKLLVENYAVPSYVRGSDQYRHVHRLLTSYIISRRGVFE